MCFRVRENCKTDSPGVLKGGIAVMRKNSLNLTCLKRLVISLNGKTE